MSATEAMIRAIRANAVATVAQCDALLAASAADDGACQHPESLRQPRNGGGWICRGCGEESTDA